MRCFPIAHLREPYSTVGYLSQRIPVPKILRLEHPNQEGNKVVDHQWSAYDICQAWAVKRGFLTAKAARPDVYRSANHLLRMALDGRTLCLAFYPPNFTKEKNSLWVKHPELKPIESIREMKLESDSDTEMTFENKNTKQSSDEEEDEEESEEESIAIGSRSKFAILHGME